jgi:hypothetical protein
MKKFLTPAAGAEILSMASRRQRAALIDKLLVEWLLAEWLKERPCES